MSALTIDPPGGLLGSATLSDFAAAPPPTKAGSLPVLPVLLEGQTVPTVPAMASPSPGSAPDKILIDGEPLLQIDYD